MPCTVQLMLHENCNDFNWMKYINKYIYIYIYIYVNIMSYHVMPVKMAALLVYVLIHQQSFTYYKHLLVI